MSQPEANLQRLLQTMAPVLNDGSYVFATMDPAAPLDLRDTVATIREAEGLSVVLTAASARLRGLPTQPAFAWITLQVHSDLQAVGLTAAFAAALGREGISCNVVAGHHHDHIFVPLGEADRAMAALQALQASQPTAFAAG